LLLSRYPEKYCSVVACHILHVAVIFVVVVVVAAAVWRPWKIYIFDKWQQINIINNK